MILIYDGEKIQLFKNVTMNNDIMVAEYNQLDTCNNNWEIHKIEEVIIVADAINNRKNILDDVYVSGSGCMTHHQEGIKVYITGSDSHHVAVANVTRIRNSGKDLKPAFKFGNNGLVGPIGYSRGIPSVRNIPEKDHHLYRGINDLKISTKPFNITDVSKDTLADIKRYEFTAMPVYINRYGDVEVTIAVANGRIMQSMSSDRVERRYMVDSDTHYINKACCDYVPWDKYLVSKEMHDTTIEYKYSRSVFPIFKTDDEDVYRLQYKTYGGVHVSKSYMETH